MNYIDTQDLRKYSIKTKDAEIGHVSDFYFDEDLFYLRYFVVDTEPFLLRNLVLVSPISLYSINQEEEVLEVSVTKEELEESPKLDSVDVISRQYEKAYNDHFSWPYYWGYGSSAWAVGPYGVPWRDYDLMAVSTKANEKKQDLIKEAKDNNLRSGKEVCSYAVKGSDGSEFGHIQGYILDPKTLSIDFIIIDTINYFPSKNILLRPEWVEDISWKSKFVKFPFSKEVIKSAPAYSKGKIDHKIIKDTDEYFSTDLNDVAQESITNDNDYPIYSIGNRRSDLESHSGYELNQSTII